MKFKMGAKFEHKNFKNRTLEILSVENGFYHCMINEGTISHHTDKEINEHYTLITPKAPVKGKVYKVWDNDPDDYRYSESSGKLTKDGVFETMGFVCWNNYKLVVQEAE